MIRLDEVTVAVRGRVLLNRVSAIIPPSTITHLTGENGSGKTTLVRAIAGLQRYSGSIRFSPSASRSLRPPLYVCFDDAPVMRQLSGYENVRLLLGRSLPRRRIADFAPQLASDDLLRMRAGRLSHGQRKRLHLLAAVMCGAETLILDEALNGVDLPGTADVADALARYAGESTVLITGHVGDAATDLASRQLILAGGTITERPTRRDVLL